MRRFTVLVKRLQEYLQLHATIKLLQPLATNFQTIYDEAPGGHASRPIDTYVYACTRIHKYRRST